MAVTVMAASCSSSVSGDLSVSPETEQSPIDLVLSISNKESQSEVSALDESLAECMRLEGFEWHVGTIEDRSPLSHPGDPSIDPASDEWISIYGLGVSTLYFPQSGLPDRLVGYLDDNDGAGHSHDSDKNDDYYEGLDEASKLSYDQALWGEGGCSDKAELAVLGVGAMFEVEFAEDLQQVETDFYDSPLLYQFEDQLQRCLAAAGYNDFTRPIDFETQTYRELEHIAQNEIEQVEIEEGVFETRLTADGIDQLEAIQIQELTYASELTKCTTISEIGAVHRQARNAAEVKFIEEHREDIENFLKENS